MDSWFEDFSFRETRAYVHSTSLCNSLANRFAGATHFELVLRRWMDSRVVFTPVPEVDATAAGMAKIQIDGRNLILALTEDKTRPVTSHDGYDEDSVMCHAVINANELLCNGGPGTFFDRLIAANKALINKSVAPGVRLIAAKVETAGFPADDTPFRLLLEGRVGTKIFKSGLWLDEMRQGEVIFYGE